MESTKVETTKSPALNKADVMCLLPNGDTINKAADDYGFRVPYDGSNNFYDEVAIKHFLAGIRFVEQHVSDELDGNNANTVLAPVFPCKIKVDGDEYTSQEICQAFGFAHREFMFRVAISQMKERHAKVSERYL